MKSVYAKKNEEELKKITDDIVECIIGNGKLRVNKIILYGSYARGEAEDDSDIDIMVLCDDGQEHADKYAMDIFRKVDEIAFENDVLIQTNVKNIDFFNHWKDDLPYYRNISKDGVPLYG